MQFSLKRLLLVIGVIAFLICFIQGACVHFTRFETAENVSHVDWLPDEASNVSFYKSYSYKAFEFDISENGFLEWAQRWDVQPIASPVTILRYSLMTTAVPDYNKPNPTQDERLLQLQQHPSQRATIRDGYYYDYEDSSYGGVSVAYDRSKGRAYLQSNPR